MPDPLRTILLFLALFCCIEAVLFGQTNTTSRNGVQIISMGFDTTRLDAYRADPDYQYQRRAPEPSLLSRLWNNFLDYLESLFAEGSGITERFLVILLIIGAILVLTYFFLRSRFQYVFAKGDRRMHGSGHVLSVDTRSVSLDTRINNALDGEDYRMAYRYTYIQLLKQLHQQGMLRLHGDKTNRDYTREMQASPVQADFLILAEAFDFTWYGDYPIDRDTFEKYRQMTQEILKQVPHR